MMSNRVLPSNSLFWPLKPGSCKPIIARFLKSTVLAIGTSDHDPTDLTIECSSKATCRQTGRPKVDSETNSSPKSQARANMMARIASRPQLWSAHGANGREPLGLTFGTTWPGSMCDDIQVDQSTRGQWNQRGHIQFGQRSIHSHSEPRISLTLFPKPKAAFDHTIVKFPPFVFCRFGKEGHFQAISKYSNGPPH